MIRPIDSREPFTVPAFLQAAWIRRLRWHYDLFNYLYCGQGLRPPIIRLGSAMERLGEWNASTRTITISEEHILSHSWEGVLGTLRHEMAHQYVAEVLGRTDAMPHGEEFRQACRILRADPRASARGGDAGRIEASNDERDRMLGRVKDLLALARSPNEHEAASAMRMAHKYLLKYNLELSELDPSREYETRYLGTCSKRIQEYEYKLANILQDHFFVLVIFTFSYLPRRDREGRILEISGTRENVEIAEYVYKYIMNLTGPLWLAHRRTANHPLARPLRGRGNRGSKVQYLAGLLKGFEEKLDLQKKELKEEQGLIWRGDPRLDEYHRHRHPRIRSTGGCGVIRGQSYAAGMSDGRRITIRRGVDGASSRGGGLLPGP